MLCKTRCMASINTLRPRQNSHHFQDDILKCILLTENIWILIKISLKFVLKCPVNNIPALVQIMAWRLPGDKPLSEPMLVSLLMYICITRPQWVNTNWLPFCRWRFEIPFLERKISHLSLNFTETFQLFLRIQLFNAKRLSEPMIAQFSDTYLS